MSQFKKRRTLAFRRATSNAISIRLLKIRNRHLLLLDIIILLIAPTLALMLRIETFLLPSRQLPGLLLYTALALLVYLPIYYMFGLYRRYWIYASIDDMVQIALAVLAGTLSFFALTLITIAFTQSGFPRSVPLITGLLVLLLVGGNRFILRYLHARRHARSPGGKRVLVYGAGDAGSMIVREMLDMPHLGLYPVAYIDDDPRKHNMRIHGLPVLGGRHDLDRVVKTYEIDRVIITIPSAPGKVIREISDACDFLQVDKKTVPNMSEVLDGTVHVSQLRDVAIQDLLRRDPVRIDIEVIHRANAGSRVLVTGGGGSIGGELCRQILGCRPQELIVLGHGENSVFEILHDLRRLDLPGPKLTPVVADIRFPEQISAVFDQTRPHTVFHAAAHKHVPLMEANPAEAITNNVLGTQNLLDASLSSGVERFVMLSTDKAVNPVSVMGASKRVAELLVHNAAQKSGRPFVAVRFGNVLGSRGSVLFTFKQQIADGGPVTVTDPEVTRYFMTIPEAVQLVLQASVLGSRGEVFVLDMGDPIRIDDLARDMIRLSGLEPETDIPITYCGLRPGEKLFEELFLEGENYHRTDHEKIFIVNNQHHFGPHDQHLIDDLLSAADRCDQERILRTLHKLLPEYHSDNYPGPALADQEDAVGTYD